MFRLLLFRLIQPRFIKDEKNINYIIQTPSARRLKEEMMKSIK